MFGKNKTKTQTSDYEKIVDIFEERFWIAEPLPEAPWVTMLNFYCRNDNYEEHHALSFDISIENNTTLEEIRDTCKRYAQNARDVDEEEYDMDKGSTVNMQLADELDSCVVELDRAIAEKTKSLSRKDKSR